MTTLVTDVRRLPRVIRLVDERDGIPEQQKSRLTNPYEADRLRRESGLDLVIVAEGSCPVVKLLDYGRLRYIEQRAKRQLDRNNRQQARGLKEFQFTPQIAQHDYAVKLNAIREALDRNHDVRLVVRMNYATRQGLGRYQTLADAVRQDDFVLHRLVRDLGETARVTASERNERSVSMTVRKAG